MKQYLIEAIVEKNEAVVDSWDLFTYDDKNEALTEAKCIAENASFVNAKLMGYTDVLVHEVEGDEYGSVVGCEEIASFKVK